MRSDCDPPGAVTACGQSGLNESGIGEVPETAGRFIVTV